MMMKPQRKRVKFQDCPDSIQVTILGVTYNYILEKKEAEKKEEKFVEVE